MPQADLSRLQAGTEDSTLISQGVLQCILPPLVKQLSETISLFVKVKSVFVEFMCLRANACTHMCVYGHGKTWQASLLGFGSEMRAALTCEGKL